MNNDPNAVTNTELPAPAPAPAPSSAGPGPVAPPPRKAGLPPSLLFTLGCGGFLVLAVVGTVVAGAMAADSASVDDSAVLKMTIAREVPEYVQETGLEDFFGPAPITVAQHLSNLKKAASDKRVKGVLLKLEPAQLGWAKVEELRDGLVEFKKSGKFLIAWAEMMDEKSYALALPADEIILPKDSPFEFNGLAMDLSHYPGLLEKAGIEVQYFRYGKYKSVSGQQYGLKAFTEPVKEMIEENLDVVYGHFVDAVALHRKLDRDQVVALLDEGHLKSDWALEHKLIDKVAYWDEVEDELRQKTGKKPEDKVPFISASKYRKVSPKEAGLPEAKHTFALIYSQGLIVAGKGGGDNQGAQPIITALRKAVDDKEVKAIIFRVDSPGGAGLGCDYVRREIEKARAKKPVIVSMSDVAASGGYWVSMDATAIVAQPTTATGSIGIFSVVPSLGGLYEKLDLNDETFKRGAHADAIIGARKMSDDEAQSFDRDLHDSYLRFVSLAAKGRKMDEAKMEELAQGRTWYGSKALEHGLVDKLGGFPAAIALGKEKAGLPADATVKLELFHKKKGVLEELLDKEKDDDESGSAAATLVTQALKASPVGPLLARVPAFTPFAEAVVGGERTFPLVEWREDFH